MEITELHSWDLSISEAISIQKELRNLIIKSNPIINTKYIKYIAGVDTSSISKTSANSAVVILKYPELELIEYSTAEGYYGFPYIPGLLSFREMPLIISAFRKLKLKPDIIFVDGQGLAHPRRFGLACHLGLLTNIPTIGCAKSVLCGSYEEVPDIKGGYTYLIHDNEIVGAALRTRQNCKPLFVSVGHLVDLDFSIEWTIKCCSKYRLPEPTRLAHLVCKHNHNTQF